MGTQANNRALIVCYEILSLLLVTVWAMTTICAQEPSPEENVQRQIPYAELRTAPGELIAQGINNLPVGPMGLKTYRLEEVKLQQPIQLILQGHKKRVESVFRLTVTGESFVNAVVSICLDDEPAAWPVSGNTEVTAIIYDRDLVQHGASISILRVLRDSGPSRTTLPERLEIPEPWRTALRPANEFKPTVRLRRIASSPAFPNEPVIEMLLTGNAEYPPRNAFLMVAIGDEDFRTCGPLFNGDPHTVVCHFSEEQFAKLKDGDPIRAKYEVGPTAASYQRFGRLNKSLLDKR